MDLSSLSDYAHFLTLTMSSTTFQMEYTKFAKLILYLALLVKSKTILIIQQSRSKLDSRVYFLLRVNLKVIVRSYIIKLTVESTNCEGKANLVVELIRVILNLEDTSCHKSSHYQPNQAVRSTDFGLIHMMWIWSTSHPRFML